jgi:sRNA-binding regulator protein Hfq
MSYLTPEQARAEQLREGQRMARCDDDTPQAARPRLGTRPGYEPSRTTGTGHLRSNTRAAAKPNKQAPVGHEAFVKALQESGARIKVYLLDQDEPIVGKIRAHDKYTISVEVELAGIEAEQAGGFEVNVIFKHAIQRFVPLRRTPAAKPAVDRADEGHAQ